MKIFELLNSELIKDKTIESCKLFDMKNQENKDKFKYQGVYILVDSSNDEVIYVGSAYARFVRKRLLQYQEKKNTGNSSLYLDLIENSVTISESAESYIKSLTVYSFKDESLEYKLINMIDSLANKVGNDK